MEDGSMEQACYDFGRGMLDRLELLRRVVVAGGTGGLGSYGWGPGPDKAALAEAVAELQVMYLVGRGIAREFEEELK